MVSNLGGNSPSAQIGRDGSESSDLGRLQSVLLDLYKQVKRICDEEGFQLFALGGTLLGAVRHQGFIPWDDDVDVALPRPQYERFLQIADSRLPAGCLVERYFDEGSSLEFQARVVKERSEVITAIGNKPKRERVFIDVFPLDAMPTNRLLRSIHKYRLLASRMKVRFSMIDSVHQTRRRPLHERALMWFCKTTRIGSDWNTVELYLRCEQLATRYFYDEEDWIVNLFGTYKFKEMFPKAWFGVGVPLQFEDTTILCPEYYDQVLSQMYGDYMKLPPVELRGQQHKMTVVSLGDE